MAFSPNGRGKSGMFIFPAAAECFFCHEKLAKRHGINQNRMDEQPTVMGWILFDVGPYCLWCATRAWTDPDLMRRSGSNDYHARRWGDWLEKV